MKRHHFRRHVRAVGASLMIALHITSSAHAYPGHVFQSPAPVMAPARTQQSDSEQQSHSISDSGAAQYTIPIVVPPGRQGMAPGLALSYSSRNPIRGGVAAGWALNIPRIEVDTTQGRLAGTHYRSSLTGTRLIPVAGEPAPSNVTVFRAEYDTTYARYERHNNSDGTTSIWRVRTPDGHTRLFGETTQSKDVPHVATQASEGRWFMNREVDEHGNEIEYTYAKISSSVLDSTAIVPVDIYPTVIQWGKNSLAATGHHAKISFSYAAAETCPNSMVPIGAQYTHRNGFPLMEGYRRIQALSIQVLSGSTWVERGRYELGYDMNELACPQQAHAPLRLLTSVTRSAVSPEGVTVTLPATTFEYGRRDLQLTATAPLAPVGTGLEALADKPGGWPTIHQMNLDLDGDGVLDRLAANPTGAPSTCQATWSRSLGNGQLAPAQSLTLPAMPWRTSVRKDIGPMFEREGCSLSHQYSRADTIEPGGTCGGPANYNSYRFMDVTGDGRPDLVTAIDSNRGQYQTEDDLRLWPAGTAPSCPDAGACRDEWGNPTICKVVSPVPWPPFTNSSASLTSSSSSTTSGANLMETEDPDDPSPDPSEICPTGGCPPPSCEFGCTCHESYCEGYKGEEYPFGAPVKCPAGPNNPNGEANEDGECPNEHDWNGLGWELGPVGQEGKAAVTSTGEKPNCIPWPESTCGRYVWRVYANTGAGFATAPQIVLSPLPLESDRATSSLGAAPLAASSSWHGFLDLDGDGQLDAIHQDPFFSTSPLSEPLDPPQRFNVFRGDGTGNFYGSGGGGTGWPFYWKVPAITNSNNVANYRGRVHLTHSGAVDGGHLDTNITRTSNLVTMVDLNGDGLPDYVDGRKSNRVRVFYNHGKGFQNQWDNSGFKGNTLETDAWGTKIYGRFDETHQLRLEAHENGQVAAGWSRSVTRPVDIDADGLIDLVEIQPPRRTVTNPWLIDDASPHVKLYINTGDKLVPMGSPASVDQIWRALARIQITDGLTSKSWTVKTDFLDLDGDGLPEAYNNDATVNLCTPDPVTYTFDLGCGQGTTSLTTPRDGIGMRLLKRVTNGRGGDLRFSYAPVTGVPTPVWVVDKITSNPGPGAGGAASPDSVVSYRHESPVYAPDQRGDYGFRGFRTVRRTDPSGAHTVVTYAYDQNPHGSRVDERVFDAEGGRPHAIVKTLWQRLDLFGGKVPAFVSSDREYHTCKLADTETTCATGGAIRRELDAYITLNAPSGTPLAWVLANRVVRNGMAPAEGDQRFENTHQILASEYTYRIRPQHELRQRIDATLNPVTVAATEHVWDSTLRVENSTKASIGVASYAITSRTYDLGGNITGLQPPSQYGTANWLIYTYDPLKLFVTSTTNQLGHVATGTWDVATGAQLSSRGPNEKNGVKDGWNRTVDGLGRELTSSVYIDDPATGSYKPVTTAKTTYTDLPSAGAGGHVSVKTEKLIEFTEGRWTSLTTELDGAGRTVVATERTNNGAIISAVTRSYYDAAGDRYRVDSPSPTATGIATLTSTATFDPHHRVKTTVRPDGTGQAFIYDGRTVTRSDVTAGKGGQVAETRTTTDAFGRITETGERLDDGTWALTKYFHDGNNNVRRIEDADGLVTEMEHDWLSRRKVIRRGNQVWSYGYNKDGQVVSEVAPAPAGADPSAYTTSYAYDLLGRETSRVSGARGLTADQLALYGAASVTRVYDENPTDNGKGRLSRIVTPKSNVAFKYEARGLVRERTDAIAILDGTFSDTRVTKYTYNALGAPNTEVFGDGAPTGTDSTKFAFATNDRGLPKITTWSNQSKNVASYTQWASGHPNTRSDGFTSHATVFDTVGRVKSQTVRSKLPLHSTLTTRAVHTYGYDGADDLVNMTSALSASGTSEPVGSPWTFGYDRRHQLTAATGPAGYVAAFDHTPGGRIEYAKVDAASGAVDLHRREVTYHYDVDGDPESPDSLRTPTGAEWMHMDHDRAGNTTTRIADGITWNHVYDGADLQREVTASNGSRELYWYDGARQRVVTARYQNGQLQEVRWTFGDTEIRYTPTAAVQKTIAHVRHGGRSIARVEDRATLKYVFTDHYGHPMAHIAANGMLAAGFVFGPYGELLQKLGADADDVRERFNGKDRDVATGLSYYGYRYLDPRSLTWTQADPKYLVAPDAAPTAPRRAALYAFSLGSPLRYVDPDGRDVGFKVKVKKSAGEDTVDEKTGKWKKARWMPSVELFTATAKLDDDVDAVRVKLGLGLNGVKLDAKFLRFHKEGRAGRWTGGFEAYAASVDAEASWKRASFGVSGAGVKVSGSVDTCLGTFSGEAEARAGVKVGGGFKEGKVGTDFGMGSLAVGYDPSGFGSCIPSEHIWQPPVMSGIPAGVMQTNLIRDSANIASQPAPEPEPEPEPNSSEGGTPEDQESPAPDYEGQRSWGPGAD